MMWISWKHSRKCRIIRIVSRTGFQIGTERAISRDIRDWNIQREHYPRIYSDKGCKMSDSADFEDFIIKYTALVVFRALLCLFFSVFSVKSLNRSIFRYTLRVHFESNWSLFYIVWLFVQRNVWIKALWHIARVRRLQLSNIFSILKTQNLFGLMRKVKIESTIKDFSKLIGIGRQGWHIWADF